jgi:hypothetical protein
MTTLVQYLESIDREIAFYRRRSGQVFFLGVSSEAAIVVGAYKLEVKYFWKFLEPLAVSYFFFAVAFVGIILGLEYRRRIRILKKNRADLIERGYYDKNHLIYPSFDEQVVSEIQVLIWTLIFTSFISTLLFCLRQYPYDWMLYILLLAMGESFCLAIWTIRRCLKKKSP